MPFKTHKQYRLPNYDYSQKGDYYITICTKNRIPHFGKIIQHQNLAVMELSGIGEYLEKSILAIFKKYDFVTLGETIIMPNHVHLVITILNKIQKTPVKQSIIQQSMSKKKDWLH